MIDDSTPPDNDESTSPLVERIRDRADRADSQSASPPERIREMMAMFSSFGPAPHPLADKITAEHIDKMLSLEDRKLGLTKDDRSEERHNGFRLSILAVLFVLLLVGMLLYSGNAALIQNVLSALIGLVAGALGGYGLGRSKASE